MRKADPLLKSVQLRNEHGVGNAMVFVSEKINEANKELQYWKRVNDHLKSNP